jgi:hypothetical protein
VAGPLALGLGTGHPAPGSVASLGAYLWTVGHLTDKRPLGLSVDVVTVFLLVIAGMMGALAGRYLWLARSWSRLIGTCAAAVLAAVLLATGLETRTPAVAAQPPRPSLPQTLRWPNLGYRVA